MDSNAAQSPHSTDPTSTSSAVPPDNQGMPSAPPGTSPVIYPPQPQNASTPYPPQQGLPTGSPTVPPTAQGYVSMSVPEPQKPRPGVRNLVIAVASVAATASLLWLIYAHYHKITKHSSAPTPTITKKHIPSVTTSAPASLGLGTFRVGADKDIAPGLYSLTPGPQQTGEALIVSASSKYTATLNTLEATDPSHKGTQTAWAQLSDGDIVQFSGGNLKNVTFKPVVTAPSDAPALAKLYTDSFTVTTDPNKVGPGRFLTYDTADTGAYMLVISADYHVKYNQPLNSTGFVADLAVGDQVATVNVTKIYLKQR